MLEYDAQNFTIVLSISIAEDNGLQHWQVLHDKMQFWEWEAQSNQSQSKMLHVSS